MVLYIIIPTPFPRKGKREYLLEEPYYFDLHQFSDSPGRMDKRMSRNVSHLKNSSAFWHQEPPYPRKRILSHVPIFLSVSESCQISSQFKCWSVAGKSIIRTGERAFEDTIDNSYNAHNSFTGTATDWKRRKYNVEHFVYSLSKQHFSRGSTKRKKDGGLVQGFNVGSIFVNDNHENLVIPLRNLDSDIVFIRLGL